MAIDHSSAEIKEINPVETTSTSPLSGTETVAEISRRIVVSMIEPLPNECAQLLRDGYNPEAGIALAKLLDMTIN